jgi:hypothetical protein
MSDAPAGDPVNASAAAVSAMLLGIVVTIGVLALGIGYWSWRRRRGPLRQADADVRALLAGDSGPSSHEWIGEQPARNGQQRRERYGTGFPSHRPGASDTGR